MAEISKQLTPEEFLQKISRLYAVIKDDYIPFLKEHLTGDGIPTGCISLLALTLSEFQEYIRDIGELVAFTASNKERAAPTTTILIENYLRLIEHISGPVKTFFDDTLSSAMIQTDAACLGLSIHEKEGAAPSLDIKSMFDALTDKELEDFFLRIDKNSQDYTSGLKTPSPIRPDRDSPGQRGVAMGIGIDRARAIIAMNIEAVFEELGNRLKKHHSYGSREESQRLNPR